MENYRAVSILPIFSKVYERCMYYQMYEYFNQVFSKQQCGFRRGFSTQHCLLAMTEKWRKHLDKYVVNGVLLTDLSKAFDYLLHDPLIANLAAYCFDYESLTLIQNYLSNRKRKTKVNNTYSNFSDIIFGVPQSSILGPLLFNIYICDMFYDNNDCDIASYADDNTSYRSSFSLEKVIIKLEACTNNLFKWLYENHMKANADKCHLVVTTMSTVSANIEECVKTIAIKKTFG